MEMVAPIAARFAGREFGPVTLRCRLGTPWSITSRWLLRLHALSGSRPTRRRLGTASYQLAHCPRRRPTASLAGPASSGPRMRCTRCGLPTLDPALVDKQTSDSLRPLSWRPHTPRRWIHERVGLGESSSSSSFPAARRRLIAVKSAGIVASRLARAVRHLGWFELHTLRAHVVEVQPVLFARSRTVGPEADLYTMNADGTQVRRLRRTPKLRARGRTGARLCASGNPRPTRRRRTTRESGQALLAPRTEQRSALLAHERGRLRRGGDDARCGRGSGVPA